MLDAKVYAEALNGIENVTCYGFFDGITSLPLQDFNIFLYTSQWDGMPTILMDAIAAGLPIVASDVGGVGEVIVHEKTGFLVRPFDDVTAYVNCLKRIHDNMDILPGIVDSAYDLIISRHSWERFVESLIMMPGYITKQQS